MATDTVDTLATIRAVIREELRNSEVNLANRQELVDTFTREGQPNLAREANESRLYWKGRYEALWQVARVAKVRP